ncbi:FAD-binding oxidoreductase [Haloarculaceae archaeon H-GB2-1]|nr:FAD-binding oxidoreductase [Haloarculaceae archaeon H-GB1-1]MEA5386412.1 FAD-binding oxidoreductase [Haloarculaceae archaeon H-GB11]MEA5407922.1 FAD-binding oxidoreductase [Haloarculaceae archaeon H-GB2-1]
MDPIVIVGGGIVGTSVAYHLRSIDRPIHLFEKETLGSGTTAGSVAQFTYHQADPSKLDHELRRRSREWYDRHIESGEFSFEAIGTLHVAGTDAEREARRDLGASLAEHGAETEWLEPEDLPDYDVDGEELVGGLLLPTDGVLDPSEIVQYQAEAVREAGHTIETGVEVTDVRTDDGEVTGVVTDSGTVDADVVINAAGPWAPVLDDMVGVETPIRHTHGPILVLEADQPLDLPLTFFEDEVYLRQEGRTRALAGQFVTAYENADRLDPNAARSPPESFHLDIAEVVEKYVTVDDAVEVVNEWEALRTVTPDGQPIVDETAVDDYVVATGMSGFGITTAPAVGELTAELLTGEEKSPLLEHLSLDRFE